MAENLLRVGYWIDDQLLADVESWLAKS